MRSLVHSLFVIIYQNALFYLLIINLFLIKFVYDIVWFSIGSYCQSLL